MRPVKFIREVIEGDKWGVDRTVKKVLNHNIFRFELYHPQEKSF